MKLLTILFTLLSIGWATAQTHPCLTLTQKGLKDIKANFEIVQDYGFARFANIGQKAGGVYLPENTTFAKQTVGHNTLVVNHTSQYNAISDEADKHTPTLNYHDFSNPEVQIISSKDSNAYNGVRMNRTLVMVDSKDFKSPFLIDIFKVNANTENTLDLPLYYLGQVMSQNFSINRPNELKKLGNKNGYQHIWKEAQAVANEENSSLTWLNAGVFHTYITATTAKDSIFLGRIGASDPNFNLRPEPVMILRRKAANTVFASLLESHGTYSPVTEKAVNAYTNFQKIELKDTNEGYTALELLTKEGQKWLLVICNQQTKSSQKHQATVANKKIEWQGYYTLIKF